MYIHMYVFTRFLSILMPSTGWSVSHGVRVWLSHVREVGSPVNSWSAGRTGPPRLFSLLSLSGPSGGEWVCVKEWSRQLLVNLCHLFDINIPYLYTLSDMTHLIQYGRHWSILRATWTARVEIWTTEVLRTSVHLLETLLPWHTTICKNRKYIEAIHLIAES